MGGVRVLKERAQRDQPLVPSNDSINLSLWRPWEGNIREGACSPNEYQESDSSETENHFCDFGRTSEHNLNSSPSPTFEEKQMTKCRYCPETFTRRDNLTRHEKMKHLNGSLCPTCPFCFKRLSRNDAVKRHQNTCRKRMSSGKRGSLVRVIDAPLKHYY